MFQLKLIYSACLELQLGKNRLIVDPWLYNGAYYGAWDINTTHDVKSTLAPHHDFIILTHIHPDHYCKRSIEYILSKSPSCRIIVADWAPDHTLLHSKLISDGFTNLLVNNAIELDGRYLITQYPLRRNSSSDIDSYHIISDTDLGLSLLNLNDCKLDSCLISEINNSINKLGCRLILTALGYAGAGPYPQCFYGVQEQLQELLTEAENKRHRFLNSYISACSQIQSVHFLPFAGNYILSDKLRILNEYRGISTLDEAVQSVPNAISLREGIDIYDVESHSIRSNQATNAIRILPLENSDAQTLPSMLSHNYLLRLLNSALNRAHSRSECESDHHIHIYYYDADTICESELAKLANPAPMTTSLQVFNCNNSRTPYEIDTSPVSLTSIFVQRQHLYFALTGLMHWNNLRTGSLLLQRRLPNIFDKSVDRYINYLSLL
jgi:hypothetical protein